MYKPQSQSQKLSFIMLIALVVGNMIGAGVYTLPAALAPFGGMALIGWCITATGAIILALMFCRLSRMIVQTGGPYAYCHAAFGDFVGFLVAYNYWVAICVGNATVVVSLVGYLGTFFSVLNEHAPGYNPWFSFAVKVSFVWLTTLINCLGVRRAGEFQLFTVFLKVLPLLLIILFGLHFIDTSAVTQAPLDEYKNTLFAAVSSSATLTLWAFIGLEAATIPAESALDVRDIAKATLYGTSLAALIYILSTAVIFSV